LGEIEGLFVGIAQSVPKAPARSVYGTHHGGGVMDKSVELNSHTDTEQRPSGDRPVACACHTGHVAEVVGLVTVQDRALRTVDEAKTTDAESAP